MALLIMMMVENNDNEWTITVHNTLTSIFKKVNMQLYTWKLKDILKPEKNIRIEKSCLKLMHLKNKNKTLLSY